MIQIVNGPNLSRVHARSCAVMRVSRAIQRGRKCALLAERAKNPFYPLESQNGMDYWAELSHASVPTALRKRMGEMLHAKGHLPTPEFRHAEERLATWPRSKWTVEEITPPQCHETLHVRYRSAMVCFADTLRNPSLDPKADCVWGPEVLTDELTDHEVGYLSDVCHGQMYVRTPMHLRFKCFACNIYRKCCDSDQAIAIQITTCQFKSVLDIVPGSERCTIT